MNVFSASLMTTALIFGCAGNGAVALAAESSSTGSEVISHEVQAQPFLQQHCVMKDDSYIKPACFLVIEGDSEKRGYITAQDNEIISRDFPTLDHQLQVIEENEYDLLLDEAGDYSWLYQSGGQISLVARDGTILEGLSDGAKCGMGTSGGAVGGALAGAGLGSVVPGIGTAIGAALGALAGAIGGGLSGAAASC